MDNEELLNKTLTYHQFCDLISSAWLVAEQTSGEHPSKQFRLALFTDLEKRVAGQHQQYWKWIDYGQFIEVVPIADKKEHDLGDECWCDPKRVDSENERPVISHNATDGRA